MPDDAKPGEKPERYMIAPRNSADPGQLQDFQRVKETLTQTPTARISESGSMLKAQISPSLAQDIRQRFGNSLIIERDAPLPDPRMMPDFKP